MPSDNTVVMILLGVVILLSLYYLFSGKPIHNDGSLQTKQSLNAKTYNDNDNNSEMSSNSSNDTSKSMSESESASRLHHNETEKSLRKENEKRNYVARNQADTDDSVDSSLEIIKERAMGLDGPYFRRKNGGRYKHDSYRALGAGTNLKEIDKQFKIPDVTKNYTDRFVPIDESGAQNAPVDIPNNKGTEKEKYDSNSYLPQEKERDWFETIETVDVKNSHLINIYRPIGANTIGSTHKYAIYDIRGLDKAVCPKMVVSPWLQSSAEPDRSSKSLCACP
jgi:hypothetical protein